MSISRWLSLAITSYLLRPSSFRMNEIIPWITFPSGSGVSITITNAVAVMLAVLLLAVKVYKVVIFGDTILVPLRATLPIPWSIVAAAAFETCQVRVDICPWAIFPGLAENKAMTGCPSRVEPSPPPSDETAIVTDLLAVPPALLAVRI